MAIRENHNVTGNTHSPIALCYSPCSCRTVKMDAFVYKKAWVQFITVQYNALNTHDALEYFESFEINTIFIFIFYDNVNGNTFA